MRCPKCGNEAPQGSSFCNQCGTRLSNEMPCPSCHNMIPSNSVFCPKCGKMVRNDMDDESFTAGNFRSTITFNEQRQQEEDLKIQRQKELQQQRLNELQHQQNAERLRRQQEAAQRQRANAMTDYDEDEYEDEDEGTTTGSFNRNLIIGVIAVVGIIGALLLMRSCNNNSSQQPSDASIDSTLVADASSDPMSIFVGELNRNNLLGDGASAASAVMVPGNGKDIPDRIWGVTYLSSATERSFIKIYELTRSGSLWSPELMHIKYLEDRTITLDNNSMIADITKVPRAVNVEGKDYLYFAYMDTPRGEGSRGRVALNLFNMKDKKLTSLNYEGGVRSRDDGRQYIYGNALDPINSPERRFLKDEAKEIKILYFQTEEELKAEQEEKERLEKEKAMASPDSADARWNQENAEKVEQLKKGEEVSMKAATYDKPIFNMRDMHKKVENENYIVFADKSGSVYGFNKDTRKYFTIYSPKGKASGPTDIGFGNSKANQLRMRPADGGHYSYDLASGKTRTIE
ncbi:MAG: zinc-ribbon domain-containing protein [Muribaculaceae bacterium]|nr:zinc-ribbon domain-containing protein [Muribaculaceae bacterium]